ncbi:MAG: seg [Parcubacteria group bacterium]|nr:seg [Parcubacteria group bacterium]
MEPDIIARLNTLEDKIDAVYKSVEKTRKYFLTSAIITVVMVVLPIVGLIFVIPSFLSSYTTNLDSLSQ